MYLRAWHKEKYWVSPPPKITETPLTMKEKK